MDEVLSYKITTGPWRPCFLAILAIFKALKPVLKFVEDVPKPADLVLVIYYNW